VEFVFPAGSTVTNTVNPAGSGTPATNPSAGGADAQRNEMNPTTRRTPVISLAAGADNPNLDAGVRALAGPESVAIPTLNEWMLMLLAMLVIGAAAPSVSTQKRRSL
jgi:IPTL-CTERM motif